MAEQDIVLTIERDQNVGRKFEETYQESGEVVSAFSHTLTTLVESVASAQKANNRANVCRPTL